MNDHFVNEVFEKIWSDRYQKDGESYEGNLRRVAKFCAKNEKEESDFFNVMNNGLFFPGGRTMSNAGIGTDLTLNNCFVAPQIEDDLKSIFETVTLGAKTHQRGGGIGYDFSKIRPAGMKTSNDAIASGPVSFMDVFNAQTATILQGGRRGANMGVLNVYHPDIFEFVNAKATDKNRLCHFNLSVMIDDQFMFAVEDDETIMLHWPVYDDNGNIIRNSNMWVMSKEVRAKELWDLIIRKAYDNGEPGVLFYDNMNEVNPLYYDETITHSNPCAEYLAGSIKGDTKGNFGGACNLGSLMLHKFVDSPFTNSTCIDRGLLKDTIDIAVRMLDNIIDVNNFPDIRYKNYQEKYRTIGLGVTGLADALCMLGFKYDSEEALRYVDELMNFISYCAYEASCNLAREKGAFPGYKDDYIYNGFLDFHEIEYDWGDLIKNIKTYGIRNGKILAVAPTGTMSLVYGNNCSSGIEPIFSLQYDRKVKIGSQDDDAVRNVTIKDYAYFLYDHIDSPDVDKSVFRTAQDMSVYDHLDMLEVISKHIDMSVSKTINVPTNYSFEDTKKVYMEAWTRGVKGCTIFRPNELRPGILNTSTEKESGKAQDNISLERGMIEEVPDGLTYRKYKIKTGCGKLYLFVGVDENEGKIYDFYTNTDGVGGCTVSTQANSRLMSAALRGGVPVEYIITQLQKSGTCPSFQYSRGKGQALSKGRSCPSAIAHVLSDIVEELKLNEDETTAEVTCEKTEESAARYEGGKCPECGEKEVVHEGGCLTCRHCGWSKCS